MQLWFDRMGFPILTIPQCALEMYLWPFTKFQLEQFLVETNAFTDSWYEELILLNPRQSYTQISPSTVVHAFATGLLFREAELITKWRGEGFRLPTANEWRSLYSFLNSCTIEAVDLESVVKTVPSPPARALFGAVSQTSTLAWSKLSLMHDGLVEWVITDQGPAGLGSPSYELYPNLWDPMTDFVVPISSTERIKYFGFRLVRTISQNGST